MLLIFLFDWNLPDELWLQDSSKISWNYFGSEEEKNAHPLLKKKKKKEK